jgi:hypothetical protein
MLAPPHPEDRFPQVRTATPRAGPGGRIFGRFDHRQAVRLGDRRRVGSFTFQNLGVASPGFTLAPTTRNTDRQEANPG